jgi:hypothetical protein
MGDDVVEFPRGRAKVFTEDEALADLRPERRHLAALARKGFLRLLARVLPKRQPPAPHRSGSAPATNCLPCQGIARMPAKQAPQDR